MNFLRGEKIIGVFPILEVAKLKYSVIPYIAIAIQCKIVQFAISCLRETYKLKISS